jgi:AcrR family transcriptional regulator
VESLKTTATRAAIIAAAMPVFVRRGIAQTRVEDLLVAAKLARRTFYKYFASKEAVVAALFDTASEQLVFAMEQARRAAPHSPMAGIRAGIDIYLQFHQLNGKVMREIIELAMRSDSLLHPRQRWLRGELVRIFDESITALDGRRVNPLVFHALLAGLDGMALEMTGNEPRRELEEVRQIAHLLVDRVLGLESTVPLPLVR